VGGGALALDAAWLFAAFLVILIVAAASIAARRFLLERGGGTVECGLRKGSGPWRLGLASYQREELCWFGALGFSMRPSEVFPRRDLTVVSRRLPSDAEAASLGPGMIVVECKLGEDGSQLGPPAAGGGAHGSAGGASGSGGGASGGAHGSGGASGGGTVELALGEAALTGLLSWLEAAPPGSHLDVAL
jgi:uncharacterized membrane protein YgcG